MICGSNGVSTTLRALEDIELNKFKRIVLLLDNDNAGDKMTKKVLYTDFEGIDETISKMFENKDFKKAITKTNLFKFCYWS